MYLYENRQYLDETDLRTAGFSKIAGCDEVGRGPGAGEVVVCCCMLPINHGIVGLRDSKKLSAKRREELGLLIQERALSLSIVAASNKEIDAINIYRATKKCIVASVRNMKIRPEFVVMDGNFEFSELDTPYLSVPGGDGAQIYEVDELGKKKQTGHHYENVAAASIVAKVYRDQMMVEYDALYPEYGFAKHKGYLTQYHLEMLRKYGPSPIHRLTFNGVL